MVMIYLKVNLIYGGTEMNYDVKDINLADSGKRKIDWVRSYMPLLRSLEEEFSKSKPFKDIKVSLSVHLEAKTAYLCKVLAAGGADMSVTGSNVLSTQDDVAAGLAAEGMKVYAKYKATEEEYYRHIEAALEHSPHIIIDDGGDLINLLYNKRPELMKDLIGGCEETTTGIIRLRAMENEGALKNPMIAVNDAYCKHMFDNRYGTGQSVWDGINRTTNLITAGKHVVVSGYGWCGKGVAMRAKGLGAKVIVTEIDSIKAVEAVMDGYEVMQMEQAAELGDIFVTVTGCNQIITKEHMEKMKDGAILCNAGHFNVEINLNDIEELAVEMKERRNNIMGYKMKDGRWINVLAEGKLVNLASGDGHPAEIMDMSFALQALGAKYLLDHQGKLPNAVISVPQEIDVKVAEMKLKSWDMEIDTLTPEQEKYLNSWNV